MGSRATVPPDASSAPGRARRAPAAGSGAGRLAVLVLSTGFRAGPWACRSLRAAGYRVVGAHVAGRLTGGRSLACPRPLRYPSPVRDPEAFVREVARICREERVSVVLPAAEDTARVMATLQPDLGGVPVVGPDRRIYDALCDKARLAETAAVAGVRHPRTAVVGRGGPDGPLPPLPCVVKPAISGEDLGGAPAVAWAATAAERDAAVEALLAVGLDAVVQERLVGPRWVGQSVRDGDGRLELVASRAELDYPRVAGVASLMRTVAEPPEPLRQGIARLLDHVDYRGPSTISFIVQDRRWVVHDVNLRLGSSVAIVMKGGLDMPRRAVEVALGIRREEPLRRREVVYARLDGELSAVVDELRGRGIGESPLRVLGRVVGAATSRHGMVDPSPLDPFWTSELVARRALPVARRVRRAVRRPR